MRIEQLWYFKEVVESKSISKAANKIFITQQALSQALYNLETEIGVQLFIRTPKGIEVTQKGLIFYEATLKVLQNFGDLKKVRNFAPVDGRGLGEGEEKLIKACGQ